MAWGASRSASSWAGFSASSAKPLISPCISITAIRGWWWRTRASSILAGTGGLLSVDDQLDRMMGLVVGYLHVVDQVLDQEEPPPPHRLRHTQLGLQPGAPRLLPC